MVVGMVLVSTDKQTYRSHRPWFEFNNYDNNKSVVVMSNNTATAVPSAIVCLLVGAQTTTDYRIHPDSNAMPIRTIGPRAFEILACISSSTSLICKTL